MIALIYIVAVIYLALITWLTVGWFRLPRCKRNAIEGDVFVSVLIPARNEEKDIINLLSDIKKQSYPNNMFEVIVIDDSSTDSTYEIVRQSLQDSTLNNVIVRLEKKQKNLSPKKRALEKGVSLAKGELIITTDADCRVKENWINSFVLEYKRKETAMISGPVTFYNNNTVFKKIQSLEFLSLIASGAGAIGNNTVLMCNGANMAYSKKAFEKVGGYSGDEDFASGDDVFLMMKMRKYLGNEKVSFLKKRDAIVSTKAQNSLHDFYNQRIRWAAKTSGYKNLFVQAVAIVVFIMNLTILMTGITAFFFPLLLTPFIIILAVKTIVDFPILLFITTFTKQKELLIFYPITQVLIIVYTVTIAFLSQISTFRWKDREFVK